MKDTMQRDDDEPIAVLSVIEGPDRGRRIECAAGSLRIGRAPDSELVVTDPQAAPRHATLLVHRAELRVRDHAASGRTRVDGVPVVEAIVRPGSVLSFGQTTIWVGTLDDGGLGEASRRTRFGDLLGTSPPMRTLFSELQRAAATEAPLLLKGETGTGKGAAAEAVHRASRRASGPFVLFDCGAAGPAGAEAQLFGGTTDSLGDATTRRRGLIEAAHGGTLVLDDVGALPMAAQSALVRLLDRGEVVAVGGIEAVPADVRIIAVSQQDLRDLVARNAFRRDLCDRLQTVSITLPPLRERRGDIPLLASHFARQLAHDAPPLGVEVMERFTASEWPGNVRELRNAVERELFLVQRPPRDSEVRLRPDLAAFMESLFDEPIKDAQDAWTGRFMRAYLANALELSGGSVSGAARLVGTNRRYIQRLMRRYGIRSADCRIILAREALTG